MEEKKYFSINGLTHLKNLLKTKIRQTYIGEKEPTDENVVVWIKPSEAGLEIPTKTSDLINNSGFTTENYVNQAISTAISNVLGGSY